MKRHLILLFTLAAIYNTSSAQIKGAECLNIQGPFQLFKRQIKFKAKPIPINNLNDFLPDSIYLKVDLNEEVAYDYLINGVRILIINSTNEELIFSDDGVITLFCQAKNESGEWKDIEWKVSSWNCYGTTMTLDKNSYFEAVGPCYQGSKQYQMRYRFTFNEQTFYSNEFIGWLNPGQLIRRKK